MFFHLKDYLKNKDDVETKNLLAQTIHRIYKFGSNPVDQIAWLNKSYLLILDLKKKDMTEDPLEEIKILTSYCSPLLKSFQFKSALNKNEAVLKLLEHPIFSTYAKLPVFANQSQIFIHQMEYEKAEVLLLKCLEVAEKSEVKELEERYREYIIKLYFLSEQWSKGVKIYRNICKNSEKTKTRSEKLEYLVTWDLFGKDMPEDLQKDLLEEIQELRNKTKSNKKKRKAKAPFLYFIGLYCIKEGEYETASEYFKYSVKLFKYMQQPIARILGVLPLVWQNYSDKARQKNISLKNLVIGIKKEIEKYINELKKAQLQKINNMKKAHSRNYLEKQELKELEKYSFDEYYLKDIIAEHLQKVENLGDDLAEFKNWCKKFRQFFPYG